MKMILKSFGTFSMFFYLGFLLAAFVHETVDFTDPILRARVEPIGLQGVLEHLPFGSCLHLCLRPRGRHGLAHIRAIPV